MESQEKKKLAVVAGKRIAPESDSTDASMEDLCRKKFKPIAPKPVIRKDQHQAVLSTALPLRKESSQRKEHVVLPTPKFDASGAFGMRPGSSFPFMCGGPMIMPIPVPVVPGKDGSYVPLQVPVPIPVMVPVVVSMNQATSPSASNVSSTTGLDSKPSSSAAEKESPGGNLSSKKDKSSKKGTFSKPDKAVQPGDGSESKGPKAKPCRYKYSMIKNESLFRDLLRGVGGDFMASHGISLAVPPSNPFDVNSFSKGMVVSLDHNKQNCNDNTSESAECSSSLSSKGKDCENASSPSDAADKHVQEVSDGSNKKSGDVTVVQLQSSQPQFSTAQGSLLTSSRGTGVSSSQDVHSSYSTSQRTANDPTVTAPAASSITGEPVCQTGPQVTHFNSCQNPSTLNMFPSVRMSEGNLGNKRPHEHLSTGMCPSSGSQTSVHSFPYYNTSNQNNVPSSQMNLPVSTPCSSVGGNNNHQQLHSQCPPTSSVSNNAPRNSNWSYVEGNQNSTRNELQNRHALRPFHNLAQRIAAVRDAEHDHPDESNFYGVDELHSFSEMDHSAGSLLSSSDDSVSAVLGMADASGPVGGALSDSPTRRAVTAIVTPLPRSASLTTTTVTSASVNSQVSGVHSSTQAEAQNYNHPSAQTQGSSDQGTASKNAQGSNQGNQFALPASSVAQTAQQWSSQNNGNVRQSSNCVTSSQNQYNVCTANVVSAGLSSQPNTIGNLSAQPVVQQRSVHPEGMQSRMSSSVTSSSSMSKEHGTITQTCQSSHSMIQTTLSYSNGPRSTASIQRQSSSMSNNFSMPNMNTNRTHVPRPNYYSNSDSGTESYSSTNRDKNPMQNSHQVPNPSLGGHGPSSYPETVHSQVKQRPYSMNAKSNDTSPNKTLSSNRQGENRHSQMQNSAQASLAVPGNRNNESQQNQMHNSTPPFSHRPQSSMRSAVPNSQVTSSRYSSANFYNTSRNQAPVTTQTVSSGTVVATSSAMGASMSASMSNPWQPPWAANVPVSQDNHFPNGRSGHQQPVSVSNQVTGPSQAVSQARHDSTTTVIVSTSVQSVPLQSNLHTRHGMAETLPSSSNQTGTQPGVLDRRVSSSDTVQLPGSIQAPMFGSNNLRMSSAHTAPSTNFSVPSTDTGPRMPYPLVPPIMFGNSAPPPRGIPMGRMSSVSLPGSFPSSVSEQSVQPSQATSSAGHHSIPPVMHDRHRMYLPSHFSSLHRPLYMPPSPAPSTDLSMLSPHSCGPLHVHDSVLYSPRYPSSIHSFSPGVNTNFHASPLHRSFPSSDHQENFARSSIGHPSPHFDSTLSPMPLRMPQLGQSSTGVNNPVSSHSASLPPSIASLHHSSIVANREQNSLFEQNLKRLLERSARRHSMAFSSTHGYPRPISCDHTFPPRPMSTLPSLSSYPPPHSTSAVSFSTPSTLSLSQSNQPQSMLGQPPQPLPSSHNTTTTTSSNTVSTSTAVTTVSTTLTPTTSSVVTSRAILGNTSDKYLPLELLSPSDSANSQATPTTSAPSTPSPQVAVDQVVKCGDTVLQCSRQVLRESGRTVLCCWHCDYHTAEPRKMKRHQKKESEPLKCQLCSFQSGSRCSVNQHYKQEHMDKDDPFCSVNH